MAPFTQPPPVPLGCGYMKKQTSASYLAAETSAWSVGRCGPAASASFAQSCGSGWACCCCPRGWQTRGSVGSKQKERCKPEDVNQKLLCHVFINPLGSSLRPSTSLLPHPCPSSAFQYTESAIQASACKGGKNGDQDKLKKEKQMKLVGKGWKSWRCHRLGPTCLPCLRMAGLAAGLRWGVPSSPVGPSSPSRAVGRLREGIWNWRGLRRPSPAPAEPAVGKELDWPKPRLWREKAPRVRHQPLHESTGRAAGLVCLDQQTDIPWVLWCCCKAL